MLIIYLIMITVIPVVLPRPASTEFESWPGNPFELMKYDRYAASLKESIGLEPKDRTAKANRTAKYLVRNMVKAIIDSQVNLTSSDLTTAPNLTTGEDMNITNSISGVTELSTLGTKVRRKNIIVTHQKYQTIIMPYQKKVFLSKISEVERSVMAAARMLIKLQEEFTIDLSNSSFRDRTEREIDGICSGNLVMSNIYYTDRNLTIECSNFMLNQFLIHLNLTTHQLLNDAIFRIYDLKGDVEDLGFWVTGETEFEAQSKSKRSTRKEIDGLLNFDYNLTIQTFLIEKLRMENLDETYSLLAAKRVLGLDQVFDPIELEGSGDFSDAETITIDRKVRSVADVKKGVGEAAAHHSMNYIGDGLSGIFGVATKMELYQLEESLRTQLLSNYRLMTTANSSRAMLDVQRQQIKRLNQVIFELNNATLTVTEEIRRGILDRDSLTSALLSTMSFNSASHVFNKAHAVLSDIRVQIADTESYFQSGMNNELSCKLISPKILSGILQIYSENLPQGQALLWGSNRKELLSYYSQIRTTVKHYGLNDIASIEFHIPFVDLNEAYQHVQINILPFKSYDGRGTYQISIPGFPDTFEVIIPHDIGTGTGKSVYLVDKDLITKGHPDNVASVIEADRIHQITGSKLGCILSIISGDIQEITEKCTIIASKRKVSMSRIADDRYIFFANQSTNVSVTCPSTELEIPERVKVMEIDNFGELRVQAHCDVTLGNTRFLGKPMQSGQPITLDLNIHEVRFNEFQVFNSSLWIMILKHTKAATRSAISKIISDIIDITLRFQPQHLEDVSERLLNETEGNLALTEIALTRAHNIAKSSRSGMPLGIWFLIYGYVAIWCVLLLIIIYSCILRRATNRTQYMYKQMQTGRKDGEDSETDDLISEGDELSMSSESTDDGQNNNVSMISKAWHVAHKSWSQVPVRDIPLKVKKKEKCTTTV